MQKPQGVQLTARPFGVGDRAGCRWPRRNLAIVRPSQEPSTDRIGKTSVSHPKPPTTPTTPQQGWWLGGVLAGGLVTVLGVLYGVSVSVVMTSLHNLELTMVRRDVRRSLDTLATQEKRLLANACDYARWDDAYNYMVTGDRDFEAKNLDLHNINIYNLDALSVVLPDGRLRYNQQLATGSHRRIALRPAVQAYLATWLRQQMPLRANNERSGWLNTDVGPMLLAVCAVTDSTSQASPRGAIVMGRTFDRGQLAAIEQELRVKLALMPLDRPLGPQERIVGDRLAAQPSSRDGSTPDEAIVVTPTAPDRIAGYVRLDDVAGKPLALLRVELKRDLYQQGILASQFLGGVLALVGVLFGFVGWWLLQQLLRESQRLARSEEALARESALRQADARYREKALALEIALKNLNLERERSESLLLNVLPASIAQQLKQSHRLIAEHFDEVTILFADIVNFTTLSERLQPIELVDLLNCIFSEFDELVESVKLEKIKTIGDAYMVAAGLPVRRPDHAEAIADMALAMQQRISSFRALTGENVEIRIGINTGMVVAGVIGTKKFIYDLWGDAVNVASRMESSSQPGRIQVTKTTYNLLKECYHFEARGIVEIKGKGAMETYWLAGKKSENSEDQRASYQSINATS